MELFPHKEVTGEVFHRPNVEVALDQSEVLLVKEVLLAQSELLLDQSDDVHEEEGQVPSPVADQDEDGTPPRADVEVLPVRLK